MSTFKYLLYEKQKKYPFEVITDHHNLEYLRSSMCQPPASFTVSILLYHTDLDPRM